MYFQFPVGWWNFWSGVSWTIYVFISISILLLTKGTQIKKKVWSKLPYFGFWSSKNTLEVVRGLFLSLSPGVWKFHTFKCYFLWRLANISSSGLLLTARMRIISLGSWSWMSVSVTIRMNDTDYFIHRWLAMLPLLNTSRENGTCPTHSGIIQLTTEYKHHQKTQQNVSLGDVLALH